MSNSSNEMQPGMQIVDQRVRSFAAITKPKSAARPAWPLDPAIYPRITPQRLADAGFYYEPADGIDTCKCFSCGIKLGGWEEGDDPLDEHWARKDKCAWAEMMCAMYMEKRDGTRVETVPKAAQLPQSKQSNLIRAKTYGENGEWWPHQDKRGWGPSIKNLAKAGFVFTPGDASEDAVMCPLCGYSVEGWEKADDPWDIHYRKKPNCRFFTMTVEPPATSKGKKRATRAPTQQQPTPAPSDAEVIEVDDTPQPSQAKKRGATRAKPRGTDATATTAPATPSQSARPGRRKGTRAGTAVAESELGESGAEVEEGDDLPEIDVEDETPEATGAGAQRGKASRSTRVTKDGGADAKSVKSKRGRKGAIEDPDEGEDEGEAGVTDNEDGDDGPARVAGEDEDVIEDRSKPSTAKGRKPRATRTTKSTASRSKGKSAATAASRRKTAVPVSDDGDEGADSATDAHIGEGQDGADILIPATVEHFDYPSDREATPQPSQAQKSRGRPRAASRAVGVPAENADAASVSEIVSKKAGRKTVRQSTAQPKAPKPTKGRPTQSAKAKKVGESKSEPVMRGKRIAAQQADMNEGTGAISDAGASDVDEDGDAVEEGHAQDADEPSQTESSKSRTLSKPTRALRESEPSGVSSYRTARTAQDQTILHDREAEEEDVEADDAGREAAMEDDEGEEEEVAKPRRPASRATNARRTIASQASRPASAQSGSASKSRSKTATARQTKEQEPEEDSANETEASRPASAASAASTASDKAKAKAKSVPARTRPTAPVAKGIASGSAPTRSTIGVSEKGRKARVLPQAQGVETEEEGHEEAEMEKEAVPRATTKSAPAGRTIKPKPKSKVGTQAKTGGKASPASAPAASAVSTSSSTVRPTTSRAKTATATATTLGIEKALPAIPTSSIIGTPASTSSAPLSQLAQFANIPPTSPISPGPHSRSHGRQHSVTTGGKSEPARSGAHTGLGSVATAAASMHSAPTRTGQANGTRDRQLQQAAREGAEASRGLIDGVITSLLSPRHETSVSAAPASGPAPATTFTAASQDTSAAAAARAAAVQPFAPDSSEVAGKEAHAELTEAELDMTVEQYIEALYEAKHAAMKAEGERVIRDFVERAEGGRRRLVGMMG